MLDSHTMPVIGWREWVALPELAIASLKAKVDSGARTSALHAKGIEEFRRRGTTWVRFYVPPQTRGRHSPVVTGPQEVTVPLCEYRQVRSSNGQLDHRPVIQTSISLMGQVWSIELTLTDRTEMGFRMLLGREALRGRFWIDPGASFLGGAEPTTAHERHLASLRKKRSRKGLA